MQIKELSDCVDVDQTEHALRTVPESLEATYAKVLCRIHKRNAEKARFMLLLIAHSFKPLSLAEVAAAASLPEPNDVLNICTSTFVSADPDGWRTTTSGRRVRLDHFSVKEYLISNSIQESTASYFYKSEQLAHLILGEALVSFLIRIWNQQPNWDPRWAKSTPFLKYSAMHWFRHAREGQTRELHPLTTGDVRSISKTSTYVAERESLENGTHNLFRAEFSAAYKAWTAFCRESHARTLVVKPWPSNDTLFPPLSCASSLGLSSHVERLLDDGADIDARSDVRKRLKIRYNSVTSLQIAACEGHLDVLSRLLGKGAAITQCDLKYIATNGVSSDKVLQLLLKRRPHLVIDEPLVMSVLSNGDASRPDALAFLLSSSDNIAIDRNMIAKAIEYSDTSDVLALLLNYCKKSIKLDKTIDTWKTSASPDQVKLLFSCPKIDVGIEERCSIYRMSLENAALLGSKDIEYIGLLSEFGLDIGAKELRQVIGLQTGNCAVSEALLNHVGYHMIDEGLLLSAAQKSYTNREDLVRFLLKHLERNLVITEQFLEDVAACWSPGSLLLMEYALQHKCDEVEVTKSAVVTAAKRSHWRILEKMMRLLLGARRQEPEFGVEVIKALITHAVLGGHIVLKAVLEVMGPNVPISEEIMELASVRDGQIKRIPRYANSPTYTKVLQDYRSKQIVNPVDRNG